MSINDGGPAFPVSTMIEEGAAGYGHQDGPATYQFGGMTLRDYFAARAMQSILLAAMQVAGPESRVDFAAIAAASFRMADEMLKAGDAA